MSIIRQWKSVGNVGLRLFVGAVLGLLVLAAPVVAGTDVYQATFIEAYGGPNNSQVECPPGTSCGTANFSRLGHGSTVVYFSGCGAGCQIRIITFEDGSQLVMQEYGDPQAGFSSPGNSGNHGYIGFGLPGNPQFLDVTQQIISGTGRFSNVSGGEGAGTVKIAGGVAIITFTGTITTP